MTELKPCPFCSKDATAIKPTAILSDEYDLLDRLYPIVMCINCVATVVGEDGDFSMNTAIDRWNARPREALTQSAADNRMIAELEGKLAEVKNIWDDRGIYKEGDDEQLEFHQLYKSNADSLTAILSGTRPALSCWTERRGSDGMD
jgi:hypothetical protein